MTFNYESQFWCFPALGHLIDLRTAARHALQHRLALLEPYGLWLHFPAVFLPAFLSSFLFPFLCSLFPFGSFVDCSLYSLKL